MKGLVTPIRAHDDCYVPFPREAVWRLIADVEHYSRWWPQEIKLRILSSGSGGVGTELEINPLHGRPFRCRVASLHPPSGLEMEYLGGFVEGTGIWLLEPEGEGTRLTYTIDTKAHGLLVALLGRLFDLGALHSKQMGRVFSGLTSELKKQSQTSPAQKAREYVTEE